MISLPGGIVSQNYETENRVQTEIDSNFREIGLEIYPIMDAYL